MKEIQALGIKPDNTITELFLSSLDDFKNALNGAWLEPIPLRGGVMYVDEEYALKPMRFEDANVIASVIVRTIGFGTMMSGGGIYGPAVLVGPTDREGNDTDIAIEVKALAFEIQAEL